MLNVATPFTAVAVSVPLTPAGVELIVTWAEDPVSRFPFPSCTSATTELSGVPAVPVDGGPVVNTNLLVIPVPVSDTVCGEPGALSATESVAEKLAADAGVKVT